MTRDNTNEMGFLSTELKKKINDTKGRNQGRLAREEFGSSNSHLVILKH